MEILDDLDLGILMESRRFRKNEIVLRCQNLCEEASGNSFNLSELDIEKEADLMILLFKDITSRKGQSAILTSKFRMSCLPGSDDSKLIEKVERQNDAQFAVDAVESSVPETVNAIRKQINKNKKKQQKNGNDGGDGGIINVCRME